MAARCTFSAASESSSIRSSSLAFSASSWAIRCRMEAMPSVETEAFANSFTAAMDCRGIYLGRALATTGGGTLVHEIVHPFLRANFPECPAWGRVAALERGAIVCQRVVRHAQHDQGLVALRREPTAGPSPLLATLVCVNEQTV